MFYIHCFACALFMYILWLLLSLLCHYFCYYKYTLDFRLFVVFLCVTYFSYIWFCYLIFFYLYFSRPCELGVARRCEGATTSTGSSLQVVLFTLGRMN